ncbi:hypothetical protein RA307_12615 [Xanthobacteraceae bacterium Astr-EGSB]|uniref:hypothetical protein n=1 Tax=Astrobacterium formosum TaxID=3069710 RepID=UPI0027B040D1|nr:hypothetical protein [Xanthobacteraceae bacterium Astr-EGSB]
MTSSFDNLLPAITAAKDAGLTIGAIKKKFIGNSKAKAKEREAELRDHLATLAREGAIWGPLKYGRSQYYFAAGRGPSIETASDAVARLILRNGVKLISRPGLEEKVTGMNKPFFTDGLKHAVASRAIVELSCGSSKYYLHREVAAEYFDFETSPSGDASAPVAQPAPDAPASEPDMSFAELLPAYRRLKAEQGGFSAVKIFDLMKALGRPKEVLHRLLVAEAKAGRISIHHTTSVELPAEVIDAGIRLPGYAEPFVTIVVKDEP